MEGARILTNSLQKLTTSHIYLAFLYRNHMENWYGIVEFANTDEELFLHGLLVDFCLDNRIHIIKTDYDKYLDLEKADIEGVLPSNFCVWQITHLPVLQFFYKCFEVVKENVG